VSALDLKRIMADFFWVKMGSLYSSEKLIRVGIELSSSHFEMEELSQFPP
jgi:hypothetical protein